MKQIPPSQQASSLFSLLFVMHSSLCNTKKEPIMLNIHIIHIQWSNASQHKHKCLLLRIRNSFLSIDASLRTLKGVINRPNHQSFNKSHWYADQLKAIGPTLYTTTIPRCTRRSVIEALDKSPAEQTLPWCSYCMISDLKPYVPIVNNKNWGLSCHFFSQEHGTYLIFFFQSQAHLQVNAAIMVFETYAPLNEQWH